MEPSSAASTYATPTGDPCPRALRADGTVVGTGECLACGCCLLAIMAPWQEPPDDGPEGCPG
jgi:hypothetical protein